MKGGKDWRDAAAKTGDDLRRIGGRSVDDAFTLPRAEMTSWPGAFLTRLEPLALVQTLNAEILASRTKTRRISPTRRALTASGRRSRVFYVASGSEDIDLK
jgi:hypothetical protein